MISSAIAADISTALDKLSQPAKGSATEWLLSCTPKLTRFKQQQAIEDAIEAFGPDADEADEIIVAVRAALEARGVARPDECRIAKDAAEGRL